MMASPTPASAMVVTPASRLRTGLVKVAVESVIAVERAAGDAHWNRRTTV
jgi:hypothetical protein